MSIIRKNLVEHYNWGDKCDGWHMLKTEGLSVIEERMPAGTAETMHYHEHAQQFFFILKGEAVFEKEGKQFEVKAKQGFVIKPLEKHRILNNSKEDLEFLVISEPLAHGDRIEVTSSNLNTSKR